MVAVDVVVVSVGSRRPGAVRQRQVKGASRKIFELVKKKFDMNNDFFWLFIQLRRQVLFMGAKSIKLDN